MNIIPDDDKLIGKTIVYAEIGGYGIKLKFSDGSILDYSSSSDGDSCWEITDDTNIDLIKTTPTIDPVKHGEWHKFDSTYYRCSNCGGWLKYDSRSPEYLKIDYKYCPKCGARMDL